MGSELKYDRGTQWLIAIGISLALHAGGLLLLATLHVADAASDRSVDAERADQAEVAETESDEKEPVPKPARTEEKPEETRQVSKPAEPEPLVKPEGPKVRENPVAGAEPSRSGESAVETHVVKKGETLSSIAKACGCTIAELAKLNGASLKKLSNLRVGQRIKVPHGN